MNSSVIVDFITQLGTWNWLVLACALFIFEFLIPGFYLLFFGLAAMITGIVALTLDIPWQAQIALFTILSVANAIIVRKFWNPHASGDEPHLSRRGQKYIGNSYTLVTAIENGRGKVKVGDTLWLVSGPDLPAGSNVKVINVHDSTLIVEKA